VTAYLYGIRYYLPEGVRTNDDLVRANDGWDAADIFAKTEIRSRRVVADGETASDLGFHAAERLLTELACDRRDIDALLFCSASRDYILPSTACLLQHRLRLPLTCAAFDYVLGCSGFVYGLWLARALILSGSARNVLLVAADAPSLACDPHDLATVSIFGDGAAAALIGAEPGPSIAEIGPTVLGTDGRGAKNLIIRAGGTRLRTPACPRDAFISMNGAEIALFSLRTLKTGIQQLLDRSNLTWNDIDLFLLHQANAYILRRLCASLGIPEEKAPIDMEDIGNTVSPSIPILMGRCMERGIFHRGQRCVLAGFGIGYSWALTLLTWGKTELSGDGGTGAGD